MTTFLFDDRSGRGLPGQLEERLRGVCDICLAHLNVRADVEISLSVVTPDEIRGLNRDYRVNDTVTDVLSFPFTDNFIETAQTAQSGYPSALGDICVCADVAEKQAADYGHTPLREYAFLTLHGLLHLLGYDHETPEGDGEMNRLQEEILSKAGIGR